MKSATNTALINFLNTNQQFYMADLYTIRLNGGFTVRYTSWDQNLVSGPNTFTSFRIERSKINTIAGIEVDTLEVDVYADQNDMLNGSPWFAAVQQGALDSATLKLERVFMPTAGDTSLGTIILFSGRVSDTEVSRTMAKITVKSELELLNTQLPRNLFQAGCLHTLFDNGCQLNKANYAVAGTVVAGSKTSINTNLGQGSDYFTLGTVKFTSGVNAGVSRSVRYYSGGAFVFALPLVTTPSVGDTFLAYPGCDKQQSTCSGKFNNLINFRGFPYVPVPETAQ
jgi:uncharacterized phage protein (TIGR02218 family)